MSTCKLSALMQVAERQLADAHLSIKSLTADTERLTREKKDQHDRAEATKVAGLAGKHWLHSHFRWQSAPEQPGALAANSSLNSTYLSCSLA